MFFFLLIISFPSFLSYCYILFQSFVSCTRGAGEVGYVMIGFGVADALSSVIFGQLEKYTGRIVIFLFGGVVHMALLIGFEVWNPEYSATWQLVMFAVGWGIGDAVLQTQISCKTFNSSEIKNFL